MVDVFDHSASCERGCQNGICESVFYSDQMNWSDNREVDGKDSEIDWSTGGVLISLKSRHRHSSRHLLCLDVGQVWEAGPRGGGAAGAPRLFRAELNRWLFINADEFSQLTSIVFSTPQCWWLALRA